MASNQLHGKKFEDVVKSTFSGASDNKRKSTSIFDIESFYDKDKGLNTSIKTKKKRKNNNEVFELADARRIFSFDEDYRMLVGLHEQKGDRKEFGVIIEYIIKKENLEKLRGCLSYDEVEKFHSDISSFEAGKEGQKKGRTYCKNNKPDLQKRTLITLNPKIDSKNQRRLQCSIKRKVLEDALPDEQIIVHDDTYKDLVLPIVIVSKQRTFKEK